MWIVTGAAGFIGSQWVKFLNEQGISDIWAVDRVQPQTCPWNTEGLSVRQWWGGEEFWSYLQSGKNFPPVTAFVHLGANSSTTETSWDELVKWNLNPSRQAWEFCVREGVFLVYASSGATYGDGSQGYDDRISAKDLKPLNLYGESKRKFDEEIEDTVDHPPYFYGLKFFNVYGPGEYYKGEMASVVYKAYHQIRSTGTLKLFRSERQEYKDGEQKRDFIFVRDVCEGIWNLWQTKPSSGIYNLGFGRARSWNDLAKQVFQAMGKPLRIEYISMPDAIRERYQYYTEAKMDRWIQAGLPRPRYDLEEGIPEYIGELIRRFEGG